MSIIRIHRKERDFFTVKREALENPNLSFKAKGVWSYAMSRKDDWNFHVSHLVKVSKEKHTAIYSAIQELISIGYCLKEQRKKEDGTWECVDYIIFETLADAEEFKKSLPLLGFPHADNPHADNPLLIKNDIQVKKDKKIEPSIVSLKKWGEFVQMQEEEFLKLVKIYSREVVIDIFQSINDHCCNNRPKGYKNYIAAFRTFHKNYKLKQAKTSWNQKKSPFKLDNSRDTFSDRDSLVPLVRTSNSLADILNGASIG